MHSLAIATTVATFPLIFMGGLVTSHQAGMSVPDWPNSYGYNMFTFPPSLWVGGIFYEHTHRLAGTVVGFLSILLTIQAWRLRDLPTRIKWLCTGVLGAVIFQGVLGGLRVVMVELDLAIVHACFAQAFFCLAAFTAVVTSRWWIEAEAKPSTVNSRRLVVLAVACVAAIYVQLIAGAVMRHYKAGLAITDYPLHYGQVIPQTDPASLQKINGYRLTIDVTPRLENVTAGQVWLHFTHRTFAYVVGVMLLGLALHVVWHNRQDRKLMTMAGALLALVPTQITLGILTVLWKKPADIASTHVAVGALTLLATFVLAVRAIRLYPRGAVGLVTPEDDDEKLNPRGVLNGRTLPAT